MIKKIVTEEQLNYLREHYIEQSRKELSKNTGLTENVVQARLKELGLSRKGKYKQAYSLRQKESDDLDAYLIKNYANTCSQDIANKFNRSLITIHKHASKLGLKKQGYFTKDENDKLIKLLHESTLRNIYQAFPQYTKAHIHKRIYRIGLHNMYNMTLPERIVKEILDELHVKYEYDVILDGLNNRGDFVIQNIDIEVQGDYYHANPDNKKLYHRMSNQNREVFENNNIIKNDKLNQSKYEVLYIWEKDLLTDIDMCKDKIVSFLKEFLNDFKQF